MNETDHSPGTRGEGLPGQLPLCPPEMTPGRTFDSGSRLGDQRYRRRDGARDLAGPGQRVGEPLVEEPGVVLTSREGVRYTRRDSGPQAAPVF
jgi:hypothetical protein